MARILIVEDEEKIARFVTLELEHEGYQVEHAADGRTLSVLDLPGTYSLRARSLDEEVTRDAVLGAQTGQLGQIQRAPTAGAGGGGKHQLQKLTALAVKTVQDLIGRLDKLEAEFGEVAIGRGNDLSQLQIDQQGLQG